MKKAPSLLESISAVLLEEILSTISEVAYEPNQWLFRTVWRIV
jgi:hypothetical protein